MQVLVVCVKRVSGVGHSCRTALARLSYSAEYTRQLQHTRSVSGDCIVAACPASTQMATNTTEGGTLQHVKDHTAYLLANSPIYAHLLSAIEILSLIHI